MAGDLIVNRAVSGTDDPDVQSILGHFRSADVGYANCETLFHDFAGTSGGDGIYPAVEAGWSYMRSPPEIASELRAFGIDLVSTANNHALDYSYGGLRSTLAALDRAGVAHTGAGPDLAVARSPAFVDTPTLRVALVSMTTTSTAASRAGLPHDGIPGRPGVNPLRFHFTADAETLRQVVDLHTRFGWWVARTGEREWQINPPGLHNSIVRYFEVDEPGAGAMLDPDDVAGNLNAIRNAKAYADLVIVHVHNHEWDQDRGPQYPARFLPPFARQAIDAGADVFFAQGGHAPFRGIEVHKGKPIFYDTGDLFSMASTITRYPHDFYVRHAGLLDRPVSESLTVDALRARGRFSTEMVLNPKGGTRQGRGQNGVVPVLAFDAAGKLAGIELFPFVHRHGTKGEVGLPFRPDAATGRKLIDHLAKLSRPFGATVAFEDGRGRLQLG